MTKLIYKVKKALENRRGETLVESIVSMLVFSMLLVAVGIMISAAFRISAVSLETAQDYQEEVNEVILGNYSVSKNLHLEVNGQRITIPVVTTPTNSTMFAFKPEVK